MRKEINSFDCTIGPEYELVYKYLSSKNYKWYDSLDTAVDVIIENI